MDHFCGWQPIRFFGQGEQPRTGRHLNYLPAWDATAICDGPDDEIPRLPPANAACPKENWQGEIPYEEVRQYVYWNRHVDRRFHIEYPHATREYPRDQGAAITDPDREWDTLIAVRDRTLAEAGLTPQSPPLAVAKCLAELWAFRNFDRRPLFAKFAKEPRQINHPVDALLHKSWCIGASQAFIALMDSLGFPARGVGSQGHRTAEVFIEGRWRYAENSTRHPDPEINANDSFIDASYMELILDPWGEHRGARLTDRYRGSLWWRVSGWYHFVFGTWTGPHALHFTTQNAAAIYPEVRRLGIKTFYRDRLPLLNRSCSGFCWPAVHGYPRPDYFCHRFMPGEKLRESIWLDATDDIREIELLFTFQPSRETDWSEATGRTVFLQVGDFRCSLADLGAWPPEPGKKHTRYPAWSRNPCVVARVPRDAFRAHGLTWYELQHHGRYPLFVPCVPAVLEPYIAPLWTETKDRYGPPLPPDTSWANVPLAE